MTARGFILVILLIITYMVSLAQSPNLTVKLHGGKILKHSKKLLFNTDQFCSGIELQALWQTDGSKHWHKAHHAPQIGLSLFYMNLGDKEVLGSGIGLVSILKVRVLKLKRHSVSFRTALGLGYLNKTYSIDNPLNNAISAHWNIQAGLNLEYTIHIKKHWSLSAGLDLTHYSNGNAFVPNTGINLVTGTLAFRKVLRSKDDIVYTFVKPAYKKHGPDFGLSLAWIEYQIPGGPQYPVYIASLSYYYHTGSANRWHLGTEYEFNQAIYDFGLHTYGFNDKESAAKEATRLTVFAGHEFLFGRLSLFALTGTYFAFISTSYSQPVYFKLSLRYYLPLLKEKRSQFYLSGFLKSHLFNAEYAAFGLGCSF